MKLFLILVMIHLSTQLELTCKFEFKRGKIDEITVKYACDVTALNILHEANEKVSKVFGDHIEGKSNNDVAILNILGQNLTEPPIGLHKMFPNLEVFKISESSLEKLAKSSFEGMKKLKEIDIEGNNLENLPEDVFEDLIHLEYLNMAHNSVQELSNGIFKKLITLKKLRLKGNYLIKIDVELLKENVNLEIIDFSDNRIQQIDPNSFSHLKKLKFLDLSGNWCIPKYKGTFSESYDGEFTIREQELVNFLEKSCGFDCEEITIELANLIKDYGECELEVERITLENEKLKNRQKACLLL